MANDGIRIDISQLDFNNGKEIAKDDYKYNSMNCGSTYSFWNGDKSYILYDGINSNEAEYIITEFKKAGYLDDNIIDMDEINEFLTSRYDAHFGEGAWEKKGDTCQAAAEELYNLVEKIVNTYKTEQSKGPEINSEKPGLTEITEGENAGNYSIQIQAWGDTPIEGNNNANDCLYKIIKNYYPNIESGSEEWKELEMQIMNLNPNIYGTVDESGTWNPSRNTLVQGSRQNSVIYTGESLLLPSNKKVSPDKPTDPEDGADDTPEPQTGCDTAKVIDNIKKNFTQEQLQSLAKGNYVTYDDDSDLNVQYKNGILRVYDSQTGKELGKVYVSLSDLGYVENKGEDLEEKLSSYMEILNNNSDWQNDYTNLLQDTLGNSNITGANREKAIEDLCNYIDKMNSYTNITAEGNKDYDEQIAKMMLASYTQLPAVYSHLVETLGPEEASKQIEAIIKDIKNLGAAQQRAGTAYNNGTNRTPAVTYLSDIDNDDIRFNYRFDLIEYNYSNTVRDYIAAIMLDENYDRENGICATTKLYNDMATNINKDLSFNINTAIQKASGTKASAEQIQTLVDNYNSFINNIYPNATALPWSAHNKEAKQLKKEAEEALQYFINNASTSSNISITSITNKLIEANKW